MTYSKNYPYTPRIVLITGATGDFGKSFAGRFAAAGSKIILHGRDASKVSALKLALEETYGVQVHPWVFDIQDKSAMQAAFNSLPSDFTEIDLLINNAGLALGLEPAQDCDIEDWETMIAVNNIALVRMTRLVLSGMAARKVGHVINIGSTAGNYPYTGGNVYGATKAFVHMFSLNLRADLKGTRVRVTNIEPGMVETQFSTVRFKGDTEKANSVYANTNNLHAADIAEAVFWSATLPPYFNINRMEIMPTVQSFGGLTTERFD
jgi:3-hydroxy acid dehydrogenase / malonic semialdehyde reductase